MDISNLENIFYTYVYLDPRKSGRFTYGDFVTFLYEPYYVGKGNGYRIYDHLKHIDRAKNNKHKYGIIQKIRKEKIKPEDYIFTMISNIENKCSLCFEKYLISLIGRNDLNEGPLTNFSDGGEGINRWNDDRKKNHTDKLKGKLHSEETKNRQSISLKGKPKTQQHIENMRKSLIGKKASEETKLKMSESRKGKLTGSKNPMYNKCWIYNIYNINKVIEKEELEQYLNNGWIKGKYSKGTKGMKWNEKSKKKRSDETKGRYTLNWFINKYGEEVGNIKYKEKCDKARKSAIIMNNKRWNRNDNVDD
jgi:hypothetical protein